ncbi:MAG: hypothetical protein C0600_05495 [Ignavibacteria bacterium]|nr:MAG: hypothetical protein C0600_05495 [Ignavibacteria bacterium]
MKAGATLRICLILMLALPVFSQYAWSQTDPVMDDSLRALEKIQLEQKKLTEELDRLKAEMTRLKNSDVSDAEKQSTIETLEQRISKAEARLEALEYQVNPSAAGGDEWADDEEEWEQWEEGWEEEDDEWSWWQSDDTEGDQFNFEENFFKKYPGNFPWMFPVTTRLQESFLRYNRVEGLYLGFAQPKRLYWHSKPRIVSTASLGYGFANHTWRYSLGLGIPFYLKDMIIEISGEGYSFTDSKDQWSFDRDENTITSILAREDFLDYFERRGFNVTAAWYYRGEDELNIRASAAYVHDTYGNMNRATNWSIFGGDKVFRPNPHINDGNVNSVVLSAGLTTLASLDTRTDGWEAQLQYEMAGGFAAGDFEFTQLIADIRRYQPLGSHFNFNTRFRGGFSDGLIPQQRAFELGGPGTLPGYRYKEFAGSHVMLLSAELIIRSTLVHEARGWAKNVLRSTNIIFFANAGSTNGAMPLTARDVTNGALDVAMTDDAVFNNWKSDIGVALGSEDGNFRIGAAWRLDRSESPSLVLRFSRPF